MPSVRAERVVAAPFADVALPVVDPADVAAVAAAVLTEDGHERRAYDLTGPAAITPHQQAEALGDAIGEPTPDEQRVSPAVGRILGREPRGFAVRAATNAAAFHERRRVPVTGVR
ncbi:hypothetical protein [Cryptosporangium sp. NPDC051539]|uniref:hypothetical protein n=1 Tax=Cryptosporangium sp. NPDC051539 TaxID=3363962 RepID=UPI0037B31399